MKDLSRDLFTTKKDEGCPSFKPSVLTSNILTKQRKSYKHTLVISKFKS